MALKKTVTSPDGFVATDAYHRVADIKIENKDKLVFKVLSYTNSYGIYPPFSSVCASCDYDMNGDNPFVQAYNSAKLMPSFVDAVDV